MSSFLLHSCSYFVNQTHTITPVCKVFFFFSYFCKIVPIDVIIIEGMQLRL